MSSSLGYALVTAAQHRRWDKIGELLSQGAAVNAVTSEHGMTALYLASCAGHSSTVNLLIDNGADVNASSNYGTTPLHIASARNHSLICSVLIKRGADVNATDRSDETPLHSASFMGHLDVCRLLIQNGADPFAKSSIGRTPLYQASLKNKTKVMNLLEKAMSDYRKRKPAATEPISASTPTQSKMIEQQWVAGPRMTMNSGHFAVATYLVPDGMRVKNLRTVVWEVTGSASCTLSSVETNSGASISGLASCRNESEYHAGLKALELPSAEESVGYMNQHDKGNSHQATYTRKGLVLVGSRGQGYFKSPGKINVFVEVLLENID